VPTSAFGLRVADLPGAVRAVAGQRKGPARYTEINVTADGVNLFVDAGSGQELSYFFDGCRLALPGPPTAADGAAFDVSGVALDLAPTLIAQVRQRLPDARVETLALVTVPPKGLVWALRARSAKGGLLNLLFGPAGALLSVTDAGT
jgi:hypothetical protein